MRLGMPEKVGVLGRNVLGEKKKKPENKVKFLAGERILEVGEVLEIRDP